MAVAYSAIPYNSIPYPSLHPRHLAAVGRLYGLLPSSHSSARLLEIGCASGGNLIPVAFYLPETQCLGIEPDEGQVARGNQVIDELQLNNCRLKAGFATPAAIDQLGQFDFVICHGVFSWVDEAARDSILETIRQALSPTGVACISYNVLPGWRMRGVLRDMFRWHLQGVENPSDQIADARELMEWILVQNLGSHAPAAQYVVEECRMLKDADDSYLYHEYLCAENRPYLYGEFCQLLNAYGLHAIGDVDLSRRHAPPLADTALAVIEAIPDRHEQEQYLDFLLNRNFRQTLVARQPGAEPNWDAIGTMALCGYMTPPKKIHFERSKPVPFRTLSGEVVEITHPLTKAAAVELSMRYPAAVPFAELAAAGRRRLDAAGVGRLPEEEGHLLAECASMWIHGVLQVQPESDETRPASGAGLNALAKAMVEQGWDHVTGPRHQPIPVDAAFRQWVSDHHAKPNGRLWDWCKLSGVTG